MNHAEMKRQGHKDHDAKKTHHMGGGELPKQRTEAMIREAMDEHDDQQHGGKKMRLKLKTGGRVEGEEKRERLDRAKGGRTKHGGHKTNINIVMPPGQDHPVPVPVPAGGPPPGMMPPHPAMAGPPPGAAGPPMGPGGPPMGPPVGAGVPMPHKKGGRVKRDDGGAVVDPASGAVVPVAKGGRIKKAFGGGMCGAPGVMPAMGGAPGMMGGAGGMQHGPGPGDGGGVATMMGGAPGGAPGMIGRPVMGVHPMMGGQPGVAPGGGPGMGGRPMMPIRPGMGGAAGMQHGPGPGDGGLGGGLPPQGAVGYKRGGKIAEDAGAGSGLGRLEKTKEYGLKGTGEHENESFSGEGENKKMKRGGRS